MMALIPWTFPKSQSGGMGGAAAKTFYKFRKAVEVVSGCFRSEKIGPGGRGERPDHQDLPFIKITCTNIGTEIARVSLTPWDGSEK